jgi:5'-deoxynucleotidase
MFKFFAYLDRMKYIKRWSLMRSVREENIMEHSHQVAVIAHALALISNKLFGGNVDANKTVLLAQYHEVGEVITGDLPTPIKYFNPEIKSAYKDLEKNACERILNMLPEELKDEYSAFVLPDTDTYEYVLVKAADKLSALVKCMEEIKAGNYPQMSFAFTVAEDHYDADTRTRIIDRIGKVFDISAVSFPANPTTELHVRDYFNGVIEMEKAAEAERLQAEEARRSDLERRKKLSQHIQEVITK